MLLKAETGSIAAKATVSPATLSSRIQKRGPHLNRQVQRHRLQRKVLIQRSFYPQQIHHPLQHKGKRNSDTIETLCGGKRRQSPASGMELAPNWMHPRCSETADALSQAVRGLQVADLLACASCSVA